VLASGCSTSPAVKEGKRKNMNYETCPEIEMAIVRYFNPRLNTIVPNVWWGMGLNHECDLFVLTKSGFAYEVEIKVSRSDIKADLKKPYGHDSRLLRKLYFAIPEKLTGSIDLIPERAGVLTVSNTGHVEKLREAKPYPQAVRLSPEQQFKVAKLGTMRVWALRNEINRLLSKVENAA
jgi:hypothetical protein